MLFVCSVTQVSKTTMQIAQIDRSQTAKCTSLFETSSRVIKHGQFGDKSLGYDLFMHFCDSDQDVTRMQ